MRSSAFYELLSNQHKEALDMIALKISRIVSSDGNFRDHWHDIQGYAALGEKACKVKNEILK